MLRAINGFLPDGALINNVANFYRSAKPLTRVDGSPLVIGDVWFNPSTGAQGFWNGTYWLNSTQSLILSTLSVGNYGGVFPANFSLPIPLKGIFAEEFSINGNLQIANNSGNNHVVNLNTHNGGSQSIFLTLTTNGLASGVFKVSSLVNTAWQPPLISGVFTLFSSSSTVGTAGNIVNPSVILSYRLIL